MKEQNLSGHRFFVEWFLRVSVRPKGERFCTKNRTKVSFIFMVSHLFEFCQPCQRIS
ncbi:hypothetical protein CBM2634_U160004 [Cupriavidus taiwanensis]|uniref:Uncharacterized protein n=1 Tax=Cupriavidus taiwanensis TaxID=164546 RepID=A0A375JG17_9BURK|nr:hypothetical protein CBM2634_U160004 [Cupriavidus taiwanensis]